MPLYFAYGSNMEVEAMAQRCPSSRMLGPAKLARHRFIINTDGYATVVRDAHRTVHGLLWDLALADVRALDRYESLASGLYTKAPVPVITLQGSRKALIYFGRSTEPGMPRAGYMENVLRAAQAHGFPDSYLRELASWLPSPSQNSASVAIKRPAVTPRAAAPSSSIPVQPDRPKK